MKRRTFTAFTVLVAAGGVACGASREEAAAQPSERCAHCGMSIGSDWLASGATTRTTAAVQFDTPKCLFAWLGGAEGTGAREPWVTEYYSRERRAIDGLFFVDGSDVMGPMGGDLIPVEGRDRADGFARDHGGTVLDAAAARTRGPELFRY
jgi:copper chaperone NosL